MEGQLLAEFSNLNAVGQRRPLPAAGETSLKEKASAGQLSARQQRWAENEDEARIVPAEPAYMTASNESRPNEYFIDDTGANPPQYGVDDLFAGGSTAEERERLLRRLEMCARAREESSKITSDQFIQRDAVKEEMKRERQLYLERLMQANRAREERWSKKTQRSPFAVDLVAEKERIDEEVRMKNAVEQRKQRAVQKQIHEAHNSIFKRVSAESDELNKLRAEKRQLHANERQLRALRDVERSNARTAKILQHRREQQLQKDRVEPSAPTGRLTPRSQILTTASRRA